MLEMIKKLREETGMGMADCQKAVKEAAGDYKKALEVLKERGAAILAKKQEERTADQGRIETYQHFSGLMGAIVEVNCETDFVAKDQDFVQFAKDVAMHVAAIGPKYTNIEQIPAAELEGKDDAAKKEYIKETVLMEQSFVKNPKLTIAAYLNEIGGKYREKVVIKRFARYALGA
jgi:elongation factor Ts